MFCVLGCICDQSKVHALGAGPFPLAAAPFWPSHVSVLLHIWAGTTRGEPEALGCSWSVPPSACWGLGMGFSWGSNWKDAPPWKIRWAGTWEPYSLHQCHGAGLIPPEPSPRDTPCPHRTEAGWASPLWSTPGITAVLLTPLEIGTEPWRNQGHCPQAGFGAPVGALCPFLESPGCSTCWATPG